MSDPEKINGAASRMDEAEAVLKKFNYDKTKLVPILQEVQEKYKKKLRKSTREAQKKHREQQDASASCVF